MIEFQNWVAEKAINQVPLLVMAKAINYAANYMPSIMNYLLDGRLSLDNNRAERAIKPFRDWKKNWLLVTHLMVQYLVHCYIQSPKLVLLNKLNPYKYIAHVLDVLGRKKINELDLGQLMPYSKEMVSKFHMNPRSNDIKSKFLFFYVCYLLLYRFDLKLLLSIFDFCIQPLTNYRIKYN